MNTQDTYTYPAIFTEYGDMEWEVSIIDFDHTFTSMSTFEHVTQEAESMLKSLISKRIENNMEIPNPTPIEKITEIRGGFVMPISCEYIKK
jgi:predicted RNase H-like HicB family nuclease